MVWRIRHFFYKQSYDEAKRLSTNCLAVLVLLYDNNIIRINLGISINPLWIPNQNSCFRGYKKKRTNKHRNTLYSILAASPLASSGFAAIWVSGQWYYLWLARFFQPIWSNDTLKSGFLYNKKMSHYKTRFVDLSRNFSS